MECGAERGKSCVECVHLRAPQSSQQGTPQDIIAVAMLSWAPCAVLERPTHPVLLTVSKSNGVHASNQSPKLARRPGHQHWA